MSRDIHVEKWVYGGYGLARTDEGVVLVPFTLPGETVRIGAIHKMHAPLLEVLEPAPERIAAPCPVFQRCGGCHYQHAPYQFQLARKVEILREQLQRVGKITFDGEIEVLSAEPFGYRNRVQFHVADGKVGFLEGGSHKLVGLDTECATASPRLNQVLAAIREKLHQPQWPRFVKAIEVFTDERDIQVNVVDAEKPVARRFYDWMESQVALDYDVPGVGQFRVSPKSFFQVNRFLIEPLVRAVVGGREGETALDLYAGAGLFALPLAKQFRRVVAVEAGSAAAHDLKFNLDRAAGPEPAAQVETHYARVEDFLASYEGGADFIVADPPRAGLGPGVVKQLERIAPRDLVIVSCDPATLARDLAALPNYQIASLTLIDLFPQTFHLETVVKLERKD